MLLGHWNPSLATNVHSRGKDRQIKDKKKKMRERNGRHRGPEIEKSQRGVRDKDGEQQNHSRWRERQTDRHRQNGREASGRPLALAGVWLF